PRAHRLAVWELHARPGLDLPHGGREEARHLAGESRLHLEIGVALEEGVEDVPADIARRCLLVVHGIERGGIHALCDDDLALGRRFDRARKHGEEGDEGNPNPGHGRSPLRVTRLTWPCRRRSGPGTGWSSRLRAKLARLLERHVVGLDELVAPGFPVDPLARAV